MNERCFAQALASIAVLLGCAAAARADAGRLRLAERAGPWRVAVFTSPTPLRAGLIDVSVLVEEADGRGVARDVAVSVEARHVESGTVVRVRASSTAATNKLLQAAVCQMPRAGSWQFDVTLAQSAASSQRVAFTAEVLDASPAWIDRAGLIAWPLIPIGLFVAHQFLVARKAARQSAPAR